MSCRADLGGAELGGRHGPAGAVAGGGWAWAWWSVRAPPFMLSPWALQSQGEGILSSLRGTRPSHLSPMVVPLVLERGGRVRVKRWDPGVPSREITSPLA